jgi:small-conductance mechanosensitive channel
LPAFSTATAHDLHVQKTGELPVVIGHLSIEALVDKLGGADVAWALGLLVLAYAVGWLAAWLIARSIGRIVQRTKTPIDEQALARVLRPLRILLPLLAVDLAVPLLPLYEGLISTLRQAALVAVVMVSGWLVLAVIRELENELSRRYDPRAAGDPGTRARYTQIRAFGNISGFLVVVVTLAFAMMSIDTLRQIGAGLLASAGIAGVVLGIAAQKSIGTILAGIQLAVTQPIRVDDEVVIEGETGRIEEITLTYVVVRTWDLRRLIIPIGRFIDKPFQNWSRSSTALLGTVELHLDYSVPVDEIRKEFARVLESSKAWDRKTSRVQVTDSTEHTMLVRLLVSAKDSGALFELSCDVREKLIAYLQREHPNALPHTRAEILEDKRPSS